MGNKFIQVIKNKWLKNITLTLVLVGIIVCAYLAINFGIEKANIPNIDATKDKIYSISQETKDKLSNLENDVTITLHKMHTYFKDFAYQYERVNEHIKVEEIEDLTSKTKWKTQYGLDDTTPFVVISVGEKEKILQEYDFYTMDYTTYKEIDVTEEALTNGILDLVTTVRPKVYFLGGHYLYAPTYFQGLQSALAGEMNEVSEVNLMTTGKVPDDCNLLVITALKDDIKDLERDAILRYIKNGGKILALLDANLDNVKLTNFQKVLDEYGVSVSNGIILEGDSNKMISGSPSFVVSTVNSSSITKNMNMDLNLCLINPGKLTIEETENVTKETIAFVSSKAFYRTNLQTNNPSKTKDDEDAPGATVAAMLTKKIDDEKSSKLIIFANTVFATNTQVQVSAQYYTYAIEFMNNKDILLNSVSYLTEREENITIRKNIEAVNYEVTEAQNTIILLVIFILPVVIIVLGIVVWLLRRRKK